MAFWCKIYLNLVCPNIASQIHTDLRNLQCQEVFSRVKTVLLHGNCFMKDSNFSFRPQRRNSQKQPEAGKESLRSSQRAAKVIDFGWNWLFLLMLQFVITLYSIFYFHREIKFARTQNKWLLWCKFKILLQMFDSKMRSYVNMWCMSLTMTFC